MTAEADLIARIVAGAISGVGADQVSWDERRKGAALPAVVLHLVAPGPIYSHDGRDPLQQPRMQVSVLAASPAERERVGDAIVALLEPPATENGTRFGAAFLNAAHDLPPQTIAGGSHLFERAIDLDMTWQPAT